MLRVPFLAGETDLEQIKKIWQAMGSPTEEDWPVSCPPLTFQKRSSPSAVRQLRNDVRLNDIHTPVVSSSSILSLLGARPFQIPESHYSSRLRSNAGRA